MLDPRPEYDGGDLTCFYWTGHICHEETDREEGEGKRGGEREGEGKDKM